MINMQNIKQRLKNLPCQLEMMKERLAFAPIIMDIQTNNQYTHGEQEKIPAKDGKFRYFVEEGVEKIEI